MDNWIRFWTAVWLGCSAMSRRTVALIFCTAPATPTKEPAPTETAGEQPEEAPQEKPEKGKPEKGKPDPPKGSPGLRILCALLAIGFVYGLPWTTRITIAAATAWTITALALGYIATMRPEDKKPTADDVQEDGDEAAKETPADEQHPSELLPLGHVAVLLNEAYTEGSGVHLAHLADRLTRTPLMGLPATRWETRHVRALLAHHKVRVRDGVRVPPKGGREGVHREDFPPLPPTAPAPPVVGVVAPGQSNNNNAGNTSAPPYRITDDPDNPARHHVHHERA